MSFEKNDSSQKTGLIKRYAVLALLAILVLGAIAGTNTKSRDTTVKTGDIAAAERCIWVRDSEDIGQVCISTEPELEALESLGRCGILPSGTRVYVEAANLEWSRVSVLPSGLRCYVLKSSLTPLP